MASGSPHGTDPHRNAPHARAGSGELRKAVVSAFIGTVIEWYDFFLYGTAAALVFPKLFFPTISPAAGTMASFATYAVGFFARPVGGVVFGYVGDRFGRKVTLIWTVSLMGGATFLIGCLPSYETAGIAAPLMLLALRFVQGLAIGGEWGGAVLMTVEHGHGGRRGWYGSWAQAGVPGGLLLANGVVALSSGGSEVFFAEWGWRICFWVSIALAGIGLFIRERVMETPLFQEAKRTGRVERNPLGEVLRTQWRQIVLVIGSRMAENAGFYIFTVFVLSYAKAHLPGSATTILHAMLLGAGIELFMVPVLGALSDRIGRRPVCLFGVGLLTVGIFPFFAALHSENVSAIWIAMVLALGLCHAAMYAPLAAFFAEMFSTNIRYSGASLGYALSAPLAGGLAPLIATWLVGVNGGAPWLVAGYLMVMGVISLFSTFIAKETHKQDIRGRTANDK